MSDPLAALVVDGDQVDRAAIAAVIQGRIGIDKGSGRLVLLSEFGSLDARRKVLLILLARKAANLLGVSEEEAMSYSEVVASSGLAEGTVAPALKHLKENRLASQTADKAYFVGGPELGRATAFLAPDTPGA